MMFRLEELSSYVKAVVAVVISENVICRLEKGDGYDCCRGALDLCWEWIERKNADTCDPWDLCFYLDHETGIDLTYYESEEEKGKVYNIVLGTVMFIANVQFGEKKKGYPQYLEGIEDDVEFYQSIIDEAIAIEECSYGVEEINRIVEYCKGKIEENGEFAFCREDIPGMFLDM